MGGWSQTKALSLTLLKSFCDFHYIFDQTPFTYFGQMFQNIKFFIRRFLHCETPNFVSLPDLGLTYTSSASIRGIRSVRTPMSMSGNVTKPNFDKRPLAWCRCAYIACMHGRNELICIKTSDIHYIHASHFFFFFWVEIEPLQI